MEDLPIHPAASIACLPLLSAFLLLTPSLSLLLLFLVIMHCQLFKNFMLKMFVRAPPAICTSSTCSYPFQVDSSMFLLRNYLDFFLSGITAGSPLETYQT